MSADSYFDDPLEVEESRYPSANILNYVLRLGAPIILVLCSLGATFSTNVDLGSSNIEFGQGILRTSMCDGSIKIEPISTFSNHVWTVEGGIKVFSDGFILSDLLVSDIGNRCMGKQLIFNFYGETSTAPLNADPLRINYSADFGGFFSFEVDTPNTVQAFLGDINIETLTSGLGNNGSSSDLGSSSFHLGDWAGLYSNPGQVDARLVKKLTLETVDIPADSLSLKTGTYSIQVGRTLDSRTIWVKGLYVKDFGHADDILPNSQQSGVSIKQPFWIYVPTDSVRNVTKLDYTFGGSSNIACSDYSANGNAGWIFVCEPTANNWSLNINYSGI